MNRKSKLTEEIENLLQPKRHNEHFVECNGLFYKFEDLNIPEWKPRPGVKGMSRLLRGSQVFVVNGVKIHF